MSVGRLIDFIARGGGEGECLASPSPAFCVGNFRDPAPDRMTDQAPITRKMNRIEDRTARSAELSASRTTQFDEDSVSPSDVAPSHAMLMRGISISVTAAYRPEVA